VLDHGKVGECFEICPIADDLFYLFSLNNPAVLKVAGGARTEMSVGKNEEMFVHGDERAPLREYPITNLRHARPLGNGKALAVVKPDAPDHPHKVVAYQGGTWYSIADLSCSNITDAWFCYNGNEPHAVVLVGQGGERSLTG
jgi:hypothetical protein